ncbi:MAG TPA: hypothetical protein VHJ34_02285 [Actinomycetota bacterium]|nr:hypothetical protein [Actinomycetota bacterium]
MGGRGLARRVIVLGVVALSLAAAGCGGSSEPAGDVVPFERRPLPGDFDDAPRVTAAQASLEPRLLRVPESAALGGVLAYVVELRNDSDEDVSLDPCPAFYQAWGESGTAVFGPGLLNCDDAPPAVPAGGSVRFRMELPMPDDFDGRNSYAGTIVWYLNAAESRRAAYSSTVVVSEGACLESAREGGRVRDTCS